MIARNDDTVYIGTISFGKDSTTMNDLLLKNGYPLDEIIFTDTFKEFDEMYYYSKKVNEYFKKRYKKEITFLKPLATFEEWCFGVIKDKTAEGFGCIRGIPLPSNNESMCFHRRETKVKPLDDYLKEKYPNKKIIKYIGYTKGEGRNIKDTESLKHIYPLKNIFKMNEERCKEYLISQDMENPLYRFFSRTGCYLCPFQSERSMYQIYKNFNHLWEKMKWIEKVLKDYENQGFKIMNRYFFTNKRTCEDMEKEFNLQADSLFNFSDEPLRDCFCKL